MKRLLCEECGKVLEFGKDGVCNCGKELCYECYLKSGHREYMTELYDETKKLQESF
jgi:hypothetical protein